MSNIIGLVSTLKNHLGQSLERPTFQFCIFVQPIIYSFILYYIYTGTRNTTDVINIVVLGTGITTLWSSLCFSSAGDIERERTMGTFENIFCTPTPFIVIMIGKILANTLLGLSGFIISIIFVKIFFNANFYINDPLYFIISLLLLLWSFIIVALMTSPLFTLSKNIRALMNCIEYPMYILCGMIFPINILPNFIRPLSYIFPPTYSIQLVRESTIGIKNFHNFYLQIIILIVVSIIYLILSKYFFNKIDKLARIKGTLGV